jgi:hypothetical protein
MKAIVSFICFVIWCQTVKSQNDSLKLLYRDYPLVHVIDSISHELKNAGKPVELALGLFGRIGAPRRGDYSGVIIWKDGTRFCGMSIHENKTGRNTTKIATRKLKDIQSNRLLSEGCDLCELLNGQKKARIDHPSLMYLKRDDRFACNEIYFYDISYLYYDSNNCVYDLRQIVSLR